MRLTLKIRYRCSRRDFSRRNCVLAGNDKTRKRCSRRDFSRGSCALANNDKISYKGRRTALRCCSLFFASNRYRQRSKQVEISLRNGCRKTAEESRRNLAGLLLSAPKAPHKMPDTKKSPLYGWEKLCYNRAGRIIHQKPDGLRRGTRERRLEPPRRRAGSRI